MMKLEDPASPWVEDWLKANGLTGFLRVLHTPPWANVEETLTITSIEDLSPGAIRTFLDLEPGGEPEVETLEEAQFTEY
jgi:hypothetical protein